ncbi:hypothetical protein JIN77_01395 [Verrucomicrobiaceae bacterium R5-34]|uniref:Secreted protein n=1 Tax=Oceaniferula flava TaxID=2800421 RepID=A0AAE2S9X8_9BACT|nr:hypothetical protein [Oceaniferula flavus]MBK1829366.1 hypothetical protein [Verrucomicrobiaceae bacterium R5-34]MBK1853594.1 hypothetical protein [Oceaniferula flavus]MBM1134899.1 hypothetical protein [Oceaniferula flavus]
MKLPVISATVISCASVFTTPAQAGESSSKTVIVTPPAPECSTRQIQPLFSRYAQTSKTWTLRASHRSFEDAKLQEVDEFDGSLSDVELTVPLSESLQLRVYYPFNTNGDAREVSSGQEVEIDGNGGLLDFPSLTLDWQFKHASSPSDSNMAVYFGLGNVRQNLEGENQVTNRVDRINHRGSMASFGFKMDQQLNNCWTFVGNVGGRYYWDSDDIHPDGGSDKFFLIDASAAFIYAPQDAWIYPMVELVYQGSFDSYSSLQVVPQVIIPVCDHLDVNLGVALGLLDDSPSTDARAQVTLRF